MLENEFYNWLLSKYNKETASSRKSNCLRVCEWEEDLDVCFAKDQCSTIISKLEYSSDDERYKRNPKHKIPIDGNVRNGTATLKQAVNLYVKFKKGILINNQTKSILVKRNNQTDWPIWELPTEDEIYHLAQITTKYIRFLNPKIIERITQDNISHNDEWRDLLYRKKINPDLYLWEFSPCCFPGIRRYAGSKEIAYYRKQTEKINSDDISNALRLDDNDFPKQIWSFTFRGKYFNKFGPENYSLAHLFDHKESKNRMKEELEFADEKDLKEPLYGLYTCPSNTCYIPNSLLKPTDFNLVLRRLLFQKAESLYKDYCNILPKNFKIKPANEKWHIENFIWGKCVGETDNINDFLEYRKKIMDKYSV